MTVQQERPAGVAERTTTARLPQPRRAEPDQRPQAPVAPPQRGWGSVEDRTMARWLMTMAVCLGIYVSVFLVLGARVWG